MSRYSLPNRRVRRVRRGFLPILGLFYSAASFAQGKPEVKSVSALGVRVGQVTKVFLYGEALNPKEVTAKPPLTVKLLGTEPTKDAAKARGSKQVTLEITVPANCALDTFELTLVNPDGAKATAKIAVVENVASEVEVKHPNDTLAKAMPLIGPSIAVTGALNGDTPDLFRFEAKSGETWEITLLAGRVGSALDALLRLRDRRHLSLALSAGSPQRDRHLLFKSPTDGTYYIEITDDQARGGPDFRYRLTLLRKSK